MAAIISKLKSSPSTLPLPLENNPILQYFDIGRETSCAGPSLVWRVHDAIRKTDLKECSVFFFDKRIADKLYKPKKKESMLDRIKASVNMLDRLRHPRMLQIIHSLEEGQHTLAFASESVYASLHNILAWQESSPIPPGGQMPVMPHPISLGPPTAQMMPPQPPSQRPPFAREYHFLDIELRFGMLQIIEALHFMHYSIRQIHRNICPQIIIVTKRGTWKLFGLEFVETVVGLDPTDMIAVPPWSIKVAKICQPNLDYLAPEVQINGHCTILSDMFSLGLIICALFNQGKSLLQANNNPMLYMRQIEFLDQQVNAVLSRIPPGLQEAVQRLLSRDPHPRPSTQLLPLINYFKCQSEPAIQAMQFLDVISMKDDAQKIHFYKGPLIEALPFIPKKLRWQLVWPAMEGEVKSPEILGSVLGPIMWMTNECTLEEFESFILPVLKSVDFMDLMESSNTEPCETLLENLHYLISKSSQEETNNKIMPLLYAAMDNDNRHIQTAALIAVQNITGFITDRELHNIILTKVKTLLELNQNDVKVINLVLGFFEMVLLRLQRNHVSEVVIPTLLVMRLNDADVITRVVKLYKSMILETRFDVNTNVMATKMIPSLAPQTVNPTLDLEQFGFLMEIIYDMLENIDKQQRSQLKDTSIPVPTPERRIFRQQTSTDIINPPPFSIPNLRVERRKTSSAEEMARKNLAAGPSTSKATSSAAGSGVGSGVGSALGSVAGSVAGSFKSTGIGQWFFGSNNSTTNDGNFLRVASVFPNRRLSDNTLMTPKIRIAPSCASSPGGTPGGTSGLPTRRHSSIGPQERRGSAVNLSPPTGGSMPNTSSSVPFLLTSSMQSVRSRRPSACLSGSQGSGILHQLSSGMVRHLPVGSHGNVPQVQQPWGALQGATSAGYSALRHTALAVRKCPSLNITLNR
ncbi:SCY1-like protein 2 isoform X2 [Vanessa tameamea]|uniref:SCY1-like protein 2 isoform X2 n=1 Tax=Vanessa tameamea TaxID=334116 RepID=A0A8B8IUR1_VANTA|nr:SCY1-like protein 2 isoform X3 [Vanessa tameamea]